MDEAVFRAAYEADAANRERQSWDQYLSWVRAFYDGKRLPPVPGWRRREEEILSRAPRERRDEVARALQETGRLIATEWAKDNAVRKVSTGDLQAWGRRFADVSGDADALRAALEAVRAEIEARTAAGEGA